MTGGFSNDQDQLPLEMDIAGPSRDDDGVPWILQGTDGLEEDLRMNRRLFIPGMTLIIASHGQDLGWLTRIEELHLGEPVQTPGLLVLAEHIPSDLAKPFMIEEDRRGRRASLTEPQKSSDGGG
jgi:hypothetical protein